MDAATRRGLATLTVRGQAPHYLGNATNPAVRRALLTTVAQLLDLELDVTPFEAAVQAFRTQCDPGGARRLTHLAAAPDRPGKVDRAPPVVRTRTGKSSPMEATLPITL
jgi:hypothetical protein